MLVDFREVRSANNLLHIHDTLELSQIAEMNRDVESLQPVQSDLTAELAGHLCQVHGTVHTVVRYLCARCLEAYDAPLTAEFDESFTDIPEQATDEVHPAEGGVAVLDPFVAEAVQLALVYRPLCRDDCRGLCPVCGCNRNQQVCDCELRSLDPRWAALAQLRDDHQQGEDG
ncbi:MAG: DUF177 domain-containing protein [Alicyclobacillaceae bacterium]|nr:DUF177 domain-containing protein [Alicyclobacillaceae bacterium]